MSIFTVSNVIARLVCCPIFANVRTLKAPILMSFLGFTSGANCEVPRARDLDGTSAALLCAVLGIGKERRGKEDEREGGIASVSSHRFFEVRPAHRNGQRGPVYPARRLMEYNIFGSYGIHGCKRARYCQGAHP